MDCAHIAAAEADYVPFILQTMAEQGVAQRALASRTGISKSRLGVLLHRDPAKRSEITLREFETILHALDTNIIQVCVRMEAFCGLDPEDTRRFASTVTMLCKFFTPLARNLIEVIEGLEGIDGSEIREEWAAPLRRAVIKRLSDAIVDVADRRARLEQSDDFKL